MLWITIPEVEMFDQEKNEFVTVGKPVTLQLEHSLLSISKWESIWHKAFINTFSAKEKPAEMPQMTKDYIKCMTLTQNVDPSVYDRLSQQNLNEISGYIDNSMSATTFTDLQKGPRKSEVVTSELIYYAMVAYNIPFSCEKWHLNRLLNLIKICDIKNKPSKKMPNHEVMSRNRALNEARKAKYHTHG